MKVKVSEATGMTLDWLVAKCEVPRDAALVNTFVGRHGRGEFLYSATWALAGPIVEREGIDVRKGNPLYFPKGNENGDLYESLWIAGKMHGQTPLIAAMRCYAASKLGEEVEVPDELAKA